MSDLIATLQHIEKQPGMYFGEVERAHSIHILRAFIIGFQAGQQNQGDPGDLDCLTEWVATHYRVLAEGRGSFDIILEHVGGDERKAYDEFFRVLPDYLRDKQEVGRDGILSRFCGVQEECMEAFKKEMEDQ